MNDIFHKRWFVVGLLLAGLLIRLLFAWHQPFTNDEGAYLYDAQAFVRGVLPGGDAARGVNILFSLLAVVPLYFFVTQLLGKQAGRWAGVFWLLFAGPATWYVFGHTQAVAVFFMFAALALWQYVLVGKSLPAHKSFWLALACGSMFAFAFLSRKAAVSIFPALAALAFFATKDRMWLLKKVGTFLLGFGIIFLSWTVVIYYLYGPIGVLQHMGVGYGSLIGEHVFNPGSINPWGADIYWPFTVLGKAALGMVLGVLLGVLFLLARFYMATSLPYSPQKKMANPETILLIWLVTSVWLFALWPTFLPEYWADVWPLFCVLAAYGIDRLLVFKKALAIPTVIFLLGINLTSLYQSWLYPWTGMFTRQAIMQAADFMKDNIPLDEPALTAAVIIPYISSHRVAGEVAHPLWYHFAFIDPKVRNTFLPSLEDLGRDLQSGKIKWVLDEQLTGYAYFFSNSPLRATFFDRFQLRHDIQNQTGFRSNTLKFYQSQ